MLTFIADIYFNFSYMLIKLCENAMGNVVRNRLERKSNVGILLLLLLGGCV